MTPAATLPEVPDPQPLHILYADDMQQLRNLMGEMLARAGHAVETVNDGAAALERLVSGLNAFDLLITDHEMPRLNGLELVRHVRQLPFAGKIIVFSSALNDSVRAQYRELGVDLVLPKPLFPLTFRHVLGALYRAPGATPPDRSG